tara:strand:+ start:237 stop:707 length:471 start_codon:yes stop_codon:yes gene_type:complete
MGTPIEWNDGSTGGANELGLNSLASEEYSVGEKVDLGASFEPGVYAWRLKVEFDSAVVAGESIQVYAAAARDGHENEIDGGFTADGTEEGETDRDRLNNLKHIGNLYADGETGNDFTGSGQFTWWERYFAPVVLNQTDDPLHSSGHAFEIEELIKV